MATTPKRLSLQQVETTDLTTIYTADSGINTSASVLGFTNTTGTSIQVDIYQNDGSTDFLKRRLTIPAGAGKERFYTGFQRSVLNGGDAVKVQFTAAVAVNVSFYGREVEV